jgi:alkyl sulfatase BDS1-like metallo-beta-lactamase superfamily hydrolase
LYLCPNCQNVAAGDTVEPREESSRPLPAWETRSECRETLPRTRMNVTRLSAIVPQDEAERRVAPFGGRDAVIEAAQKALALEGKVIYPKLVPPSADTIAGSPETFVDFFRVRIDSKKRENTDKVMEIVFTDKGNRRVALHVRRGVAEFIPVPADDLKMPDYVPEMDSETWAGLYLNVVSLNRCC